MLDPADIVCDGRVTDAARRTLKPFDRDVFA